MNRHNMVGRQLDNPLTTCETPPTHSYLESSGQATYMKTSPLSYSSVPANPQPLKANINLWDVLILALACLPSVSKLN
jgi:hypothetical protein